MHSQFNPAVPFRPQRRHLTTAFQPHHDAENTRHQQHHARRFRRRRGVRSDYPLDVVDFKRWLAVSPSVAGTKANRSPRVLMLRYVESHRDRAHVRAHGGVSARRKAKAHWRSLGQVEARKCVLDASSIRKDNRVPSIHTAPVESKRLDRVLEVQGDSRCSGRVVGTQEVSVIVGWAPPRQSNCGAIVIVKRGTARDGE